MDQFKNLALSKVAVPFCVCQIQTEGPGRHVRLVLEALSQENHENFSVLLNFCSYDRRRCKLVGVFISFESEKSYPKVFTYRYFAQLY